MVRCAAREGLQVVDKDNDGTKSCAQSAADGRHTAFGLLEFVVTDLVSRLFIPCGIHEEILNRLQWKAASQQWFQIPFIVAEKTRANSAFCSDSQSIASTTERLAYGGDQPNPSGGAVGKAPIA